ncbi:hypothetical protein QVD17_08893 [Tagetes erecta]|uniref:Uncharacterized protein n=1 Tax=Tagetes erecta TaxID=13708 RepID=A0AAD8KYD9_TARER|nr:hypothetical protein QVD17_08893 [Tagetes erecta]
MHMMQPVEAPAQTSHNPFDICDCQDCLDEAYKLEYEEEDNQRKKKGSQFTLKQRYEAGDPTVGLLGEPSGKFDYYVLYGDSKPKPKPPKPSPPPPLKHPPTPPKECFTLTPAPSPQNYHTEFPPLSTFENVQQKARHSWKIENPTTIGANGVQHQITPAEATLNWQSENARPSTSKPQQDPSTSRKAADDSMMMASSKAPEDVPIKPYDPVASFLSALRRKDYVEQPLIFTDSDDESASDDAEIDASSTNPKPIYSAQHKKPHRTKILRSSKR